jgi:DNA-directed RNA polymerase specialized sigma24 family protein
LAETLAIVALLIQVLPSASKRTRSASGSPRASPWREEVAHTLLLLLLAAVDDAPEHVRDVRDHERRGDRPLRPPRQTDDADDQSHAEHAVVLRDIEGLSNEEVARVLGISLAAAKSRIHRGRMQLREGLERWERGERGD